MSTRIPLLATGAAALACAAAAAVAAPAGADTFCAPAPCADGTPTPTIEAAVAAADARTGPDVVAIAAGTHELQPDTYGQGLSVGAADTEVRGAGRDATVLTIAPLPSDAGYNRTLVSGHLRRLADLTVRLPSAVTPGHPSSVTGVDVADAVVERVRVDAAGAQFGPGRNDGEGQGMLVREGTMRDVVIDLPRDADTFGLRLGHINTDVTLDRVDVTARYAVESAPQTDAGHPIATMRASGMRIRGGRRGLMVSDGRFELRDSIVELAAATEEDGRATTAVSVYSGRAPSPATLLMDRVTLLGPGAGAAALGNGGHDPATPTTLRARHVLAAGFGTTLELGRGGGTLVTAIDHSVLPETVRDDGSDGAVDTTFAVNRTGDPLLTGPGEPTVRAGSPAVDVGGEPLLGPLPAADLAEAPRLHDGDGDGAAQLDAGALEYQGGPPAPDVPAPGGPIDPGSPSPAAPVGPAGPGGGSVPAPDRLAPQLGDLRLSSARLRVGTARTARAAAARAPRSLTVAYTLGEPATVTLTVQRKASGRRSGTRCLKAVPARPRTRSCTRWVTVHTLTRKQAAGRQSVAYTGRVGASAVRPGRHRVVVGATDVAGNRGPTTVAGFTVVR